MEGLAITKWAEVSPTGAIAGHIVGYVRYACVFECSKDYLHQSCILGPEEDVFKTVSYAGFLRWAAHETPRDTRRPSQIWGCLLGNGSVRRYLTEWAGRMRRPAAKFLGGNIIKRDPASLFLGHSIIDTKEAIRELVECPIEHPIPHIDSTSTRSYHQQELQGLIAGPRHPLAQPTTGAGHDANRDALSRHRRHDVSTDTADQRPPAPECRSPLKTSYL
ncbi:hypothetical protein LZ31DRAFT_357580 [Colletotrichum somersetense]|nr:hypothetical protein LZ31DRAFT_357580 [Colletotrichum somersetense]